MEQEPTTTDSVETSDAAERAAFLSDQGAKKTPVARASEPEVEDEPEPEPEENDVDVSADDDADDSDEATDELDDEAPRDPDTAKRLASVQKAERRAKEQLVKERAAAHAEVDARVAKLESEWAPRIKAAETFESLRSRARYNPVAVLRELGLTDDDLEPAAQQIYAHSKGAGVKPEHRAAAERASREREAADEVSATKKEVAELKQMIAKRDEAEASRAATQRYMSDIEKQATPLAKHFLAKSPERTRSRLAQIALDLLNETGSHASPAKVLAAYERSRREELEELGVDVKAILGSPAKAPVAKNGKVVVEIKKPGSPTKVSPKTDEEEREEFLRDMAKRRQSESSGD